MAESYKQLQRQTNDFVSKLTFQQKATVIGITVLALAGIIILVTMLNKSPYGVLYSNLDPQDASRIVERLRDQGIPYNLDGNGRTILVPENHIYDLRLTFAGEGLPQSSIIGYEIFDRTNLGVSDFVQKVHYRRALEGELARTIIQLEEVEAARVHIVVPERVLFREDEKPATASVVLKLSGNRPLDSGTSKAITHLVASSISGLDAEKVTIVDSRGNLLSNNEKKNTFAEMTSSQYEIQQSIESYLSKKAQSILEGVVGRGNAMVQVHADLDFRQVERTLEMFDADNPSIRSEHISEERNMLNENAPPSTLSNNITNYELNRTIEHIVENVGHIQRLSIAGIVNGVRRTIEKEGEQIAEYVPRTDEEMQHLTDIVARAVGYNTDRNDEISVVNLPFGTDEQGQDLIYPDTPLGDWYKILEIVLIILAMVGAIVVVRSLLNKFTLGAIYDEEYVIDDDAIQELVEKKKRIKLPHPEEELSEEVLLRGEKKKKIDEYLHQKPDEAARLLKAWLADD